MLSGAYQAMYRRSINDPEGFWAEAAKALHWYKPADQVLDSAARPVPRWFVGGRFNTCYNALDPHGPHRHGDPTRCNRY